LGPELPHPGLRQLAQRIVKHRTAIDATLEHRASNGLWRHWDGHAAQSHLLHAAGG
jgi:hypothetical protein